MKYFEDRKLKAQFKKSKLTPKQRKIVKIVKNSLLASTAIYCGFDGFLPQNIEDIYLGSGQAVSTKTINLEDIKTKTILMEASFSIGGSTTI